MPWLLCSGCEAETLMQSSYSQPLIHSLLLRMSCDPSAATPRVSYYKNRRAASYTLSIGIFAVSSVENVERCGGMSRDAVLTMTAHYR